MSTKKDKFSKKDKKYMELALSLASARYGLTGENPSVGCVIVKNNEIISIGQTGYGGTPHAEYNAIKNSNINLEGSKMYVTLEPCNHYGKTPPCTKLIIKKKINEVFYSIEDIDKKVKGKSFSILKSKSIIVKQGLLKNDVRNFYSSYFFNRINKLPIVTGKIATSKNNLIYTKKTKKITDIHSDKLTHYLRYKNDSIMISYKTLNTDNPKLNCRLKDLSKFSPRRVILDSNLNIKTNSYIFKTIKKDNTIIFYNSAKKQKITLFKKRGIHLFKLNLNKNKYFDLKSILKKLYKTGCRNLLVEGGNTLSGSFLKNKLFNQFYLFKSNKILNKSVPYKDFNHIKFLIQNYKTKSKINTKLSKDTITLYKKK
jgi:diaminohydroxyphosphoribosylaminopyrimidine deaminase/5-amino-6-(5-phosphoribosylamino)uracil reductase|tara:strand:+ start:11 stop:1120 length:1110 start_codon:yes stop_codon:yes gene_type:complete